MKPETVHSKAYQLSKRDQIRHRVKALMDEKQDREHWNRDRAKSFVQERLVKEATEAKDGCSRREELNCRTEFGE
jgi:hypothetical protein